MRPADRRSREAEPWIAPPPPVVNGSASSCTPFCLPGIQLGSFFTRVHPCNPVFLPSGALKSRAQPARRAAKAWLERIANRRLGAFLRPTPGAARFGTLAGRVAVARTALSFVDDMKIPAITGIIRRRILLNYRVAPEIARAVLPARFRPKLVGAHAIAGICLIRLEGIRPKGMPEFISISSENSAHRIAVEWEADDGKLRQGVFVPRRDTDSRLNALAGGRLFPGVHHHSEFIVEDHDGRISIRAIAKDTEEPLVHLEVSETELFPESSVFTSLRDSSDFFEAGCIGYSSRPDSCTLDGLLLKVPSWRVSPLSIHSVRSAYYDDRSIFPAGAIHLDHALLMRDVPHEWRSEPAMASAEPRASKAPVTEPARRPCCLRLPLVQGGN